VENQNMSEKGDSREFNAFLQHSLLREKSLFGMLA
jgi:hypothetical protein